MYPHTSYIIYATPRTGSYLLCEALLNTGLAGYPTEYFGGAQIKALQKTWMISDYVTFFDRVLHTGTTPNGVFGVKVIWQFLDSLSDCLREIPGYEKLPLAELLQKSFPRLHHVWVARRDKVRQAISYSKALQTGIWADRTGISEKNEKTVVFDFQTIDGLCQTIAKEEKEIQDYFATNDIHPFKVVYEDFVQTYQETAIQILEYLQVPVPKNLIFAEREMKKQADGQSEEWIKLYNQCKQEQEIIATSVENTITGKMAHFKRRRD